MSNGKPLTIGEYLDFAIPPLGSQKRPSCPRWPGDVAAISAGLLEKSGAYSCLGTHVLPRKQPANGIEEDMDVRDWYQDVWDAAGEWRKCWQTRVPGIVRDDWKKICAQRGTAVAEIPQDKDLCRSLFELLAICDECLLGAGIVATTEEDTSLSDEELVFWSVVDDQLNPRSKKNEQFGSTLCMQIHPSRLRVLPKSQTPQSGMSLRSLTHHLSLCPPIDVKACWLSRLISPEIVPENFCNLLLVPWPFHVTSKQFERFDYNDSYSDEPDTVSGSVGWFEYSPAPNNTGDLMATIERLLEEAQKSVGVIHMVVLPELAVTREQYECLRNMLAARSIGIICGVGEQSQRPEDKTDPDGPPTRLSKNYVAIAFPSQSSDTPYFEFFQSKHHRWKLDGNQIVRYGLSASLNPEVPWWESIAVTDRSINFFRIRSWLTTCVLICEDLARIDPVGQCVRAVGPDLVIALLLDGPQLRNRWPAYHATVLADDPGSSVLTLTSLGMTALSQPHDRIGAAPNRKIAMWRDPLAGVVEIELPKDKNACILTLVRNVDCELTADGRSNWHEQGAPTFGGVQFV